MTPQELAAQLIARCQAGFVNEFQWLHWANKHRREIDALPPPLRKAVLFAHGQATAKEFSR